MKIAVFSSEADTSPQAVSYNRSELAGGGRGCATGSTNGDPQSETSLNARSS
jgi:hypothetical protein